MNPARCITLASGRTNGTTVPCGLSAYAVGSPTALRASLLRTSQYRARSRLARRCAPSSLVSGVAVVRKALPSGLSGPAGSVTVSIS